MLDGDEELDEDRNLTELQRQVYVALSDGPSCVRRGATCYR
jgi:hypothetical protein